MDRPLVAGALAGLAWGLFFLASFFGWGFGADLVGLVLAVLVVAAAFTLPRWSPSASPLRAGLAFGAAAAVVLLVSVTAFAGLGFWSFSSDPARVAAALAIMLLVLAGLAALLGGVSWLGSRLARRAA